jgi:hypothetical protein
MLFQICCWEILMVSNFMFLTYGFRFDTRVHHCVVCKVPVDIFFGTCTVKVVISAGGFLCPTLHKGVKYVVTE